MIYLTIRGRLGNQMFQYAFARALKEKLNDEIFIDWHHVINDNKISPNTGFENSLKFFNVTELSSKDVCQFKKYMSFKQLFYLRKYEKGFPYHGSVLEKQVYERDFQFKNSRLGLFFFENGYYDFKFEKLPHNIFLSGYFESEKFFSGIEKILKKEFVPKNGKIEHNLHLYEQIENTESVCVTIRRGADFTKNKFHNVCDVDYFLRGMDIIKEKVPNAKFFIFSNDVEWIKQSVDFKYPVVFEEGSDPVWEKLRLMYSCKHFIISNSTFSWWAQYLSRNKNKIVVTPDRWFNDEFRSDLLNNSSYIKIKC